MQILKQIDFVCTGEFSESELWKKACDDVEQAVKAVDWPHGTGIFTLNPHRKGNGVTPIKEPCLDYLLEQGWKTESLPDLDEGILTTGDLDALYTEGGFNIAFEWETGNISSSHRALNKLALAGLRGGVQGGFLVVPSRDTAQYLTDRISNDKELEPYLEMWKALPLENHVFRLVVVTHDELDKNIELIPKSTAGNALAKARRKARQKKANEN